jgi:uncharacterized protein
MTATVTARPITSPPQQQPSPRRQPRLIIVVAVLAAVTATVIGLRSGTEPRAHVIAPLDAEVSGTYRLDDGALLTLWGTEHAPSYELNGRVTALMADGGGYTSMSGDETLSVQRDAAGAVRGIEVRRAGQPPLAAVPERVHDEHSVRITSVDAELAGVLMTPPGPGPHPAVVVVLGSHLARHGVAALIYDKRGVGDSTGDHATATFDDLTADALAGAELLARHPGIDHTNVGLLGYSQGGWIVAKAAQRNADVTFAIAFGASGFSPGDQQAWLHGSMLAARGFDRSAMRIADRADRMLYSSLNLVDAGVLPPIPHVPGFWFHALDLDLDTASLWEGVRQPVLLAWGARDCQVPAHDSLRALAAALERGGNTDVTVHVLPGADHGGMLVEACGHETGLGHHGGYDYADGYLTLAADWINRQHGARRTADDPGVVAPPSDPVLGWHVDPPVPAPWYGTLGVQLATVVVLLAAFGLLAGRWLLRRARGRHHAAGLTEHLTGITALTGLAATLAVCAAVTEIAMLGAVGASLLVGGPTVAGSSLLMGLARVLVTVAVGLGVAVLSSALWATRTPGRLKVDRTVWVVAAAVAVLVAWAGYWTLLPFAEPLLA